MFFRDVPAGPSDPVFLLKNAVDSDTSAHKVDLGVGVYRNEQGQYNELEAIKAAKRILAEKEPGHDYEVTTGDATFVRNAAKVLFGAESRGLCDGRLTSVQAISGTGAIHLAALFLSRCAAFIGRKVYIGTPAWGNYEPLFSLVGLEVVKYKYYDPAIGTIDFNSVLGAISEAPEGSIFVLQGCCHNPSGADLNPQQWRELSAVMGRRKMFPFFDMAYQGLGKSLEDDAFGLRHFEEQGFELVACQSFSKNFGLYGERCGALHVISESENVTANVYDQLRCLIRWEFSSSPAYGSRLVNIILENSELSEKWTEELITMRQRLQDLRKCLYTELVHKRQTPGDWRTILSSTGLFCFLPLSQQQVSRLATHYHIYMLQSGRINVSGMNQANIERIALSIDEVVRDNGTTITAHL